MRKKVPCKCIFDCGIKTKYEYEILNFFMEIGVDVPDISNKVDSIANLDLQE